MTDFDFSAHGTAGRPRQLLGGIFQTVHDKNGDFLGIASVSFRGRTPLLPGHHLTATDGTSITVSHTTRVGSGKSVVAVIGGLIAFFHTTKEMTARSSCTSCTEITNGCFHMKSSVHKRVSFFFRNLKNKHDQAQIDHDPLGKLDFFFFFFLCHFNSFHTDSVTRKQKIILFFYKVFGAFI